jgi:hypothetical protein
MTKYLAGVLSVIAVGVLLVAYGLLGPRAGADSRADLDRFARPSLASEQIMLRDDPAAAARLGYATAPAPYGYAQPVYAQPVYATAPYGYAPPPVQQAAAPQVVTEARPVRTVATQPARTPTRVVERERGRDWKKTAMIIGGSSAAGAGVGAIFGGKKGALIGAAIGGGASTIYETTKR